MPQIRPISDLRNNFTEISRIVHDTSDVIYLTRNGYGDMVVMSVELFEKLGIAAQLIEKGQKSEMRVVETTSGAAKTDEKEEPAANLKIQKPLSLWQKTLSDLASR